MSSSFLCFNLGRGSGGRKAHGKGSGGATIGGKRLLSVGYMGCSHCTEDLLPGHNGSIQGSWGRKALEETPGAWADSSAEQQSCHFPPAVRHPPGFSFLPLLEHVLKERQGVFIADVPSATAQRGAGSSQPCCTPARILPPTRGFGVPVFYDTTQTSSSCVYTSFFLLSGRACGQLALF